MGGGIHGWRDSTGIKSLNLHVSDSGCIPGTAWFSKQPWVSNPPTKKKKTEIGRGKVKGTGTGLYLRPHTESEKSCMRQAKLVSSPQHHKSSK